MEKIKTKIQEHPAYIEFSGNNEQFLSDLTGTIRDIISDLKSRNSINDEIFFKLSETIDLGNTVFRSFSNHEGLELILRLKSISDIYKRNLNDNTNLIRISEHLLKKIEKFNSSFYHEASTDEVIYPELPPEAEDSKQAPLKNLFFKWTTFERNGSLFITQFKHLEIAEYNFIEDAEATESIEYKGRIIPFADLMKTADSDFTHPAKILIIDHGKICYAADHTGREIHGSYDMISPLVEPLETTSRIFAGRVRIFGRRYLALKHD